MNPASETPHLKPFCDLRSSIEESLQSLKAFRKLAKERASYYRDTQGSLESWVVLGRYHLTNTGSCYPITEGAPADVGIFAPSQGSYPRVPNVMTMQEAQEWSNEITTSCVALPCEEDICSWCGCGWGIRNLRDSYRIQEGVFYHRECQALRSHHYNWKGLQEVQEAAGLADVEAFPIPSQYGKERIYNPPWMKVMTSKGPLIFGWRKRVISIDWSAVHMSDEQLNRIRCAFSEEEVTKSDTLIHAWGLEKAKEYLKNVVDLGEITSGKYPSSAILGISKGKET